MSGIVPAKENVSADSNHESAIRLRDCTPKPLRSCYKNFQKKPAPRPVVEQRFRRVLYSVKKSSFLHQGRKQVFDYLHNILRLSRENGFIACTRRLAAVLALALFLPALAHAYTVVMRGGHRVEIPDKFEVTQTTLTYEAAHGLNVTLQMSSIDIIATERANGESAGSLLLRAGQTRLQPTLSSRAPSRAGTRKTLTNLDLEKSRQARLESEAAYERRRQQLGLPSREETERRRAEEDTRAREILGQREIEKSEAEGYWRERATALRNEIQVLDAQIVYVRARIAETPETNYAVSYASTGGYAPYIFSQPGVPARPIYNIDSSRAQTGRRIVGHSGFGVGQASGHLALNFSNSYYANRRRNLYRPCLYAPCLLAYGVTYPSSSSSYERATLVASLRELEATRTGLLARWRQLEDEARRAGAQPGWLRP